MKWLTEWMNEWNKKLGKEFFIERTNTTEVKLMFFHIYTVWPLSLLLYFSAFSNSIRYSSEINYKKFVIEQKWNDCRNKLRNLNKQIQK